MRRGLPHHGRNGTRHVGRLRIKAAEILNRNMPDWDVQPQDIKPATGAWRTNQTLDVFRWELFSRNKRGQPVVAGCWDSLTTFVPYAAEHGCHVLDVTIYPGPSPEQAAASLLRFLQVDGVNPPWLHSTSHGTAAVYVHYHRGRKGRPTDLHKWEGYLVTFLPQGR